MEQQQTLTPAVVATMKEREPLRTMKLVAKRLAVSFSYDSKILSLSEDELMFSASSRKLKARIVFPKKDFSRFECTERKECALSSEDLRRCITPAKKELSLIVTEPLFLLSKTDGDFHQFSLAHREVEPFEIEEKQEASANLTVEKLSGVLKELSKVKIKGSTILSCYGSSRLSTRASMPWRIFPHNIPDHIFCKSFWFYNSLV
ncbi:MAG: hypothetical protein ACXAEN_23670 [Candidatus Thorarchaeota archaeon]|jgi:hypothetical protein